jgi:hypothetical protein
MLEQQHIWKRGGLARRVLRRGLGIVYNSALYGMVIYCIGCVIPTPLDRAPAPTNYSPVFVTTRVNPAFGQMSEAITSGITLSFAATDPNHDDLLTVHLFDTDSTGTQFFIGGTPLTIPSTPDPDDPDLRLGTLETALCLHNQSGDKREVFAVVADRDFMGSQPKVQEGGLSDTNHWELTCTSM